MKQKYRVQLKLTIPKISLLNNLLWPRGNSQQTSISSDRWETAWWTPLTKHLEPSSPIATSVPSSHRFATTKPRTHASFPSHHPSANPLFLHDTPGLQKALANVISRYAAQWPRAYFGLHSAILSTFWKDSDEEKKTKNYASIFSIPIMLSW